MECDHCKNDFPDFELTWNGRYIHNDTLFTIRVRKMTVCRSCMQKYAPIGIVKEKVNARV